MILITYFTLVIIAIMSLIACYSAPSYVSRFYLWMSIICGFICLLCYIPSFYQHVKKRCYALPSLIFIISYLVVGYQAYLLDNLGYDQFNNAAFFWRSGTTASYSASLVTLGFVFFVLGYVVCAHGFLSSPKQQLEVIVKKNEESKFRYGYPILIAMNTVAFCLYLFSVRAAFWSGTFGRSQQSGLANFSYLIFFTSSLCCCVINQYPLYCGSKNSYSLFHYFRKTGTYLFITTHFIALMSLRMGDRGPFIYLLLMFWGIYITQMKLRYCIISLILAASLLAIIGEARLYYDLPLSQKVMAALTERQQSGAQEAPLALTRQLSRSFSCLHILTEEVPKNYPFYYGWNFFFNGIASIVPGLRTLLNNYVYSRAPANSSDWLITHAVLGDNPPFGMGSHVIADAYLDFGVVSVIVIMFILGYLMAKADIVFSARSSGMYALAASAILLVYAVYIPRACVVTFPRYAVFCVLFLFIASRKRFGFGRGVATNAQAPLVLPTIEETQPDARDGAGEGGDKAEGTGDAEHSAGEGGGHHEEVSGTDAVTGKTTA
ncbi:O-antigen polysaccharide polymerase Wzy [Oligosphaera ethanolica]|uniref:Oligosaccharide repeat unit polymerase n=1 Tax=Oligosphaera ethanolica TaxID=760260 RepID=A0AAE3VGR0_9BACT|nr:O-antigen polysaccharide polymerase Wzy [Oligosphaera ethanolica]MDQ0289864.1 hypothetical protein [Oligosphaera ethanolica]